MHDAAVVGDDLTGTMDTAHAIAAAGRRAVVHARPGERDPDVDANASVVGLTTESRYDDPHDAAIAVRNVIESLPSYVLYKKIDSTLRGNVGPEVDAALTAAGRQLAVVAPAFPARGRTTVEGVHYVEGTPVAETEYAVDAAGPDSSAVADRFGGVDRRVTTVDRSTVRAGDETVRAAFRRAVAVGDRAPVVVCDASTDTDLATVAAAAAEFDVLYVGSAGLAEHVALPGEATDLAESTLASTGAPLGIVGSVSPTTLRQLDRVPEEAVFELEPTAALDAEADPTPAGAVERLRGGAPTVVTAATDRGAVEQTEAAGAARGLAPNEIRDRVASALGSATAHLVGEGEPSGVVLTGGDVASAAVRALDATAIRLADEPVERGIPRGRLADGPAAGTPIATKAGGFGVEGTIVNCLNALSPTDD
ncbi:ygbK domain-containing protein [Candidatus Halobonum tyrrellensis G22]|uniref:YgbK domain-containing protein n=2 Tax=Candidatus Halobonum TaxID=1431544 RepID=V4HG88_9EURY|nr:ygbK domain-containing protein [Candidatus Halobonum tyrrellensis G22]